MAAQQNPLVQLVSLFQKLQQGGAQGGGGGPMQPGGGMPQQAGGAPGMPGGPGHPQQIGQPQVQQPPQPAAPQFDINQLLAQIFGGQGPGTGQQAQQGNPYTYGQYGGEQLFTGVTGQPIAQSGELGGGVPVVPTAAPAPARRGPQQSFRDIFRNETRK